MSSTRSAAWRPAPVVDAAARELRFAARRLLHEPAFTTSWWRRPPSASSAFSLVATASAPTTYLLLAAVVALVSAMACYVPARRATRVDPLTAIRM